jgi:hypothetical protein
MRERPRCCDVKMIQCALRVQCALRDWNVYTTHPGVLFFFGALVAGCWTSYMFGLSAHLKSPDGPTREAANRRDVLSN